MLSLSGQNRPCVSASKVRSARKTCFQAYKGPISSSCSPRVASTSLHASSSSSSSPTAPSVSEPKRLAVFVSGGGSNFKAIQTAIEAGLVKGTVSAVVSDVPTCSGVQFAQSKGIRTLTYPLPKKGPFQGQGLNEAALLSTLSDELAIDYVILAGYLKLVPPSLVRHFRRRILNIHPGLLPSFGGKGYYGQRVHEAVISHGAKISGPTVHFVDEEFDTGPILAQAVVPVMPDDSPKTLAARILTQEHKIYPHCVAALCDGRVEWRTDGVPYIRE